MKKIKKVLQYNAVFQEEPEGGYSVWVPSLPGCNSQGETFDEAVHNIKEALELYLEDSPSDYDESMVKQYLVPITIAHA